MNRWMGRILEDSMYDDVCTAMDSLRSMCIRVLVLVGLINLILILSAIAGFTAKYSYIYIVKH